MDYKKRLNAVEDKIEAKIEELYAIIDKSESTRTPSEQRKVANFDAELAKLKVDKERWFKLVQKLPQVQKSGGDDESCVRTVNATLKQPDSRRLKLWNDLNLILAKTKRFDDGGQSTLCSSVKYSDVAPIFDDLLVPYCQNIGPIPVDQLELLHSYLLMVGKLHRDLITGNEAKRLCFIYPILAYNRDVQILVGENVDGCRVDVNVKFEYILKRKAVGKAKCVCIAVAKKDDLEQGMTQSLLGCEAVADIEGLDCVYGISTNYLEWIFLKSSDNKIEYEVCTLKFQNRLADKQSLSEIAGKIYAMLSDE